MDNISALYDKLGEFQKIEVMTGIENGIDVSCYAKPEYLAIQMRQIRLGLEEGLDVSVYNKPEYDWFQMEEIRLGMSEGLDYEIYAKSSIDYQRMRQLRKGLQDGVDLSRFVKLDAGILEELRKALLAKVSIVEFIKEGYDVDQLREIRKALERKVDVRPYITNEYRGTSIRQIRLGLEEGLPVSVYANIEYGWQQMREIRHGMEARIDVSQYSNSLYSWQQMHEIRLGLEDGLDISKYKSFIYTAADMKRIRKKLLLEEAKDIVDNNVKQPLADDKIAIFISRDEMEACIEVEKGGEVTEEDIIDKLKQNGICYGIRTEEIQRLIDEKRYGQTIVVAVGQPAIPGEDGRYEFFFDTNPSRSPKILPDGTADFKNTKWFELVEENQKVAYYHSATQGIPGYTVMGKPLKARRGRERNVLRGKGFFLDGDGRTYVSTMNGKIVFDGDSRLDISRVCVVGSVNLATGNISFDGTIFVKGNVGSGVVISATENVYVDGYVESATIKSGGEIFLRQGVNGNGSGLIAAKDNVSGQFFEEITVVSGGDINAQYCMNCSLHAEGNIILQGNKGLLIGGNARASKGIEAYSIGNKTGLATMLNVGINQDNVKAQQKLIQDIENVNRELTILKHSQEDFRRKYSAEVRNTMEIYLKIENAIYTKALQLKQLMEEKEQMDARMEEMRGAKVTVRGTLYEGTTVIIDNVKWKAFSVKDIVIKCTNNKIVRESQ